MHNDFTRMAIPILFGIAFGFFIGCSTLTTQNKSKTDPPPPTKKELEQRFKRIENEITKNPNNPEAYYQKGNVLNQLAHLQSSPAERTEYYRDMRRSLSQAMDVYQASSSNQGEEKIDELLKVSWSYEHNQGIEILQTDSTINSTDFEHAAGHFQNAIIIIPDSTISYQMSAQAHYRNHEVDQAISTLESAYSRIERLPSEMLEQLAFLYLENEQPQQAVKLYEEAESFSNENLNLIHGLANAYIHAGQPDKAIELLKVMVRNKPDNIIYRETYATELYNLGIQKYDSALTINPNDSVATHQIISEADTLLNEAKLQFNHALKLNPDNIHLKQQFADFHHNYAAHLRQVQSLFSEKKRVGIEKKIQSNLSIAISLYEVLVKQHPEQKKNWRHLYQAYSYLGMQQKANEAKAKANL